MGYVGYLVCLVEFVWLCRVSGGVYIMSVCGGKQINTPGLFVV